MTDKKEEKKDRSDKFIDNGKGLVIYKAKKKKKKKKKKNESK